jgi:hypothetical protein
VQLQIDASSYIAARPGQNSDGERRGASDQATSKEFFFTKQTHSHCEKTSADEPALAGPGIPAMATPADILAHHYPRSPVNTEEKIQHYAATGLGGLHHYYVRI